MVDDSIHSLRGTSWALLAATLVFLIAAFITKYFGHFPLPSDPLEQLTLIATDPFGWPVQAILFPVCHAALTVVFGLLAARLPEGLPRWLGIAAAVLFGIGALLWLPISGDRLRVFREAPELTRLYNPATPPVVFNDTGVFWPHTVAILAAIGLMGGALALGGVLPTLGWVIVGLAVVGGGAGVLLMRDWPPFLSYVILLVLAVGLLWK